MRYYPTKLRRFINANHFLLSREVYEAARKLPIMPRKHELKTPLMKEFVQKHLPHVLALANPIDPQED